MGKLCCRFHGKCKRIFVCVPCCCLLCNICVSYNSSDSIFLLFIFLFFFSFFFKYILIFVQPHTQELVKRNPPSGFTASHVHAIPISSYYIYFIIILRSCGHFNVRRRQIIIADCAVGNINSTKKNFSSISLGARKK